MLTFKRVQYLAMVLLGIGALWQSQNRVTLQNQIEASISTKVAANVLDGDSESSPAATANDSDANERSKVPVDAGKKAGDLNANAALTGDAVAANSASNDSSKAQVDSSAETKADEDDITANVTLNGEGDTGGDPDDSESSDGRKASEPETELDDEHAWLYAPKQNLTYPDWVMEYVTWHADIRAQFPDTSLLDETKDHPLVLIRICPGRCAGLHDRMSNLIGMLRNAYESKRILLLKWYCTYDLESFLMPNNGKFNWTVPIVEETASLESLMNASWPYYTNKSAIDSNISIAVRELKKQPPLDKDYDKLGTFYAAWHLFFRPTPLLVTEIAKTMSDLNLLSGKYTAMHLRVRHPANWGRIRDVAADVGGLNFTGGDKRMAVRHAIQAMQCTRLVVAGNSTVEEQQVYVLSDSQELVRYLINETSSANATDPKFQRHHKMAREAALQLQPLVARPFDTPAAHLDAANMTWTSYASVFVDLYIMVHAKCISIGFGNFAVLAIEIAHNRECVMQYSKERAGALRKVWAFRQFEWAQTCPYDVPM